MNKIKVFENDVPKKTISLKDGAVTIGRSDDNDIHIKDSTVSSRHAKIVTYYEASYVEDLGSTNGTFVNGKRIQKHILHPGDVISLGTHTLKIENDQAVSDVAGSFADDLEINYQPRGLIH